MAVPDNARRQLMGNANMWDVAMPGLCVRPDALCKHWGKTKRSLFTKLAKAGWGVADALTRIRDGERRLDVLVGRLDPSER